jgi:TonB family protein
MAAGAQARRWTGPSRRRVPRFQLQAPLDVTVLRSGVPDKLPGRSVNVGERGIAAVLAGELAAGEAVEVQLPLGADPLRARALVRHHDKLRCGLEFVGLSPEQRVAIRDWTKGAKVETELLLAPEPPIAKEKGNSGPEKRSGNGSGGGSGKPRKNRFRLVWVVLLVLGAIVGSVLWWRWMRAWEELESGLKSSDPAVAEKPQAQVPAEVMEKLLIHRVQATYPAEARQAGVQGIIALDIVIGRDGSVVSMRPLNGPDVLARAATDALRWWKFEPYRINGEPAVVETTVAVEFKR